MLLKFEDYINESLWKKGIERSKTGEIRLEDKDPVIQIENCIEYITEHELNTSVDIITHVEESEDENMFQCRFRLTFKGHENAYVPLNFYISEKNRNDVYVFAKKIIAVMQSVIIQPPNRKYPVIIKYLKTIIKGIQDKFNVSESLWKKGIERSKTGGIRMEDKDKIFYQPDVHPVPGFNDWFYQFTAEKGFSSRPQKCVKIYHKPNEKYAGVFNSVKRKPNKRYMIVSKTSFGSNVGLGTDEYNLMKSNEFVDAINNDMDKLPPSAFVFKDVSESLWKRGIERSKTGGERLEDTNINNLKGVDIGLPFLIANKDLVIKGEDRFNMSEMKSKVSFFKSHGWRVPTIEDIEKIIDDKEIIYALTNDGVVMGNPDCNDGVGLFFPGDTKWGFYESYWLIDSRKKHEKSGKIYDLDWQIKKDDNPDFQGLPRIGYGYCEPQNRKHIRLIKDK